MTFTVLILTLLQQLASSIIIAFFHHALPQWFLPLIIGFIVGTVGGIGLLHLNKTRLSGYEVASSDAVKPSDDLVPALLDTAIALTNTLELERVVDHVLTNLERIIDHHEANIMILDGDEAVMLGQRNQGGKQQRSSRFPLVGAAYPNQMIATKQPIIVENILADDRIVRLSDTPTTTRSYIGVPIILDDEVIGFINLGHSSIGYFSETHARYLQIFAFQTGVAIKNARMFEQVKSATAQQERERIAREVADRVMQTIFSANTIAEALPRMIELKPEKAKTYLKELIYCTRGASSNLRALLIELEPAALEKTELTVLLRQLGDSFAHNHNFHISYNMTDKMLLSLSQQTVIYRIVQEALNNIVNHANASEVELRLQKVDDVIKLSIMDNGDGFDTTVESEGSLGLTLMQERAQAIGLTLDVVSQPNSGTQIRVQGIPT